MLDRALSCPFMSQELEHGTFLTVNAICSSKSCLIEFSQLINPKQLINFEQLINFRLLINFSQWIHLESCNREGVESE